jgi:hypothetical protein
MNVAGCRLVSLAARGPVKAAHGDRDIAGAGVDFDPHAFAVPGSVAGSGDSHAAVAGVGHDDAGQVAQDMRDSNGYLTHDDPCAGTPAGGAELWRDRRQVPADGLSAATSSQRIPPLLQAEAGMDVTRGVPAEPVLDLVAICRAPVRGQQIQQCLLVLAGRRLVLSHDMNLDARLQDGAFRPPEIVTPGFLAIAGCCGGRR